VPAEGSYRLSRAEHARIFGEKILPRFIRDQQPQAEPVAVLLGGQPGIGESSTKSVIVETLQARGGVVDFSADLLRPRHPRFAELMAGDERSLAALDSDINQDARAWVDLLANEVARRRLNAIVDSDLASPDRARGFIDRFGGKGYRIEVQFVAGPAALSRLGVLQRFQDQLERFGSGTYCATSIQERDYAGVLDTAAMLDSTVCVDRVAVSRRGGASLHEQQRVDGHWAPAAGSATAIQRERARRWEPAEQNWYIQAATQMLERLPHEYLRDLRNACVMAQPLFIDSPSRQQLKALIEAAERAVTPAAPAGSVDAEEAQALLVAGMSNALPPNAVLNHRQHPPARRLSEAPDASLDHERET
jgi:hypothetical protein